MNTRQRIEDMYTSEEDRGKMVECAELYDERAEILEEAAFCLECYASLEEENHLINDERIADDINEAYNSIKTLAESHRNTAKISRKMADSEHPVVTVLESLLEVLKEK